MIDSTSFNCKQLSVIINRENTRNAKTYDLQQYETPVKLPPKKTRITTTKRNRQPKKPQLNVPIDQEATHNLREDYGENSSLLSKKTLISASKQNHQPKKHQLIVRLDQEPIHNLRKDYSQNSSVLSKNTQISATKRNQQPTEPQLVLRIDREPSHNLREDYGENNSLLSKETLISASKQNHQPKKPQIIVRLDQEPIHNLRQDYSQNNSLLSKNTQISATKRNQQPNEPQLVLRIDQELTHNLREDYGENSSLLFKKTQLSTTKRNQKEPQIVDKNVQEPTHNLRQKKRADYNENSTTITEEPSEKKHIPIYRTKLALPPQPPTQATDLYDFIDTSPKVKVKNKRRSSIIFDKNTFEILQRLQEKENKLKRKVLRKPKKTYESRLNGILSNINQKIAKRIHDKLNESQPLKPTSKQQKCYESPRDECVVHVKNFDKELNIVANLSTVKEREETNPTKELSEIENLQDKEAVSDTSAEQGRALNTQDLDLILLQSIGSCDNSVILKDLESGFDFDNDPPSPCASTPIKTISILSNKLLRPANNGSVKSPVNFLTENPNANSTMVQAGATGSPWRANWINVKRNPHLVNVKANALPTVDQEMVLDHSIVENYENHCSKPQPQQSTCSAKTKSVQKSILDFVESNVDKENSKLQCSLYDADDFNSPEKSLKMQQIPLTNVKRKVLGELNNMPAQPNLAETNSEENTTYFGFEQGTCASPENDRQNDKNMPSRFDLSNLKKYTRRVRQLQHLPPREDSALSDDINESVSMLDNSSGECVGEIQLFEDPEKMFDHMESFSAEDKKLRKKRLHSCEMDDDDHMFKRKTKKTKLEIEQEAWIQDFNKICDDIDNSVLEIE